eukprot:Awhi_evm1s15048
MFILKEGKSFTQAKLVPTYYDRLAYSRCLLFLKNKTEVNRVTNNNNLEFHDLSSKITFISKQLDKISLTYTTFFNLLDDEHTQNHAIEKLGIASYCSRSTEFSLNNANSKVFDIEVKRDVLKKMGKTLFYSIVHGFSALLFVVEQTDVQTIFERMAFKDKLFSYMHKTRDGVNMSEGDLIRNLLLSYFQTEEKRIQMFLAYWKDIEVFWNNDYTTLIEKLKKRKTSEESKKDLGAINEYQDQNRIRQKNDTPQERLNEYHKNCNTSDSNGDAGGKPRKVSFTNDTKSSQTLQEIISKRRKRQTPTKRNSCNNNNKNMFFQQPTALSHVGGSGHLSMPNLFPAYSEMRKYLEKCLLDANIFPDEISLQEDKVETIVENIIKLFFSLSV